MEMRAGRKKAVADKAGTSGGAIAMVTSGDDITVLRRGEQVRQPAIDRVSLAYLPLLVENEEEMEMMLRSEISDASVTHTTEEDI